MQVTIADLSDVRWPALRRRLRRRLTHALARNGAWGSDEEQTRPRARRSCSARGFRPRIALGWDRPPIHVAAAVDAVDRSGRALGDLLERAERGEPPIPGAADAALAHVAGIDPSVALLALGFISERHYQARMSARTATPRTAHHGRRSRSRAQRSHRSSAASIGKLAAADPDPDPDPPNHRRCLGCEVAP